MSRRQSGKTSTVTPQVAAPTPSPAPKESTTPSSVVQLTEAEYLSKVTGAKKKRTREEANVQEGGSEGPVSNPSSSTAGDGLLNMELLATDAIYRILHATHRSDVVEFSKCVLGDTECTRLAGYLQNEYTRVPLRRLKLQLGVTMPGGFHRLLPSLTFHCRSIRHLDLSRNRLNADDVVTLCRALSLTEEKQSSSASSCGPSSVLEVLDLSWNRQIGNEGARFLLHALRQNVTIRALILKSISIDDEGAKSLAPMLWARPVPYTRAERPQLSLDAAAQGAEEERTTASPWQNDMFPMSHRSSYDFFVNLNENCIGAPGVMALRRDLPGHVSLTVVQQHIKRDKK